MSLHQSTETTHLTGGIIDASFEGIVSGLSHSDTGPDCSNHKASDSSQDSVNTRPTDSCDQEHNLERPRYDVSYCGFDHKFVISITHVNKKGAEVNWDKIDVLFSTFGMTR